MRERTVDGYRIPKRRVHVGAWLCWGLAGVIAASVASLALFVAVRLGMLVFAP